MSLEVNKYDCNLYEKFSNLEKETYYPKMANPFKSDFSDKAAQGYIKKYFECGKKKKVFELNFIEEYYKNGKHIHTVCLYYLGCLLKEVINENLKQYLTDRIEGVDQWGDFRYTWFLTSLYHDIASTIEQSRYEDKSLQSFLSDNNIEYTIYNHKDIKESACKFTFPENIVNNYFTYRIKECKVLDHGILGGFLLFDKLRKNYESNFEKCKKNNPNANYNDFIYSDLSWKREHIDHFAVISDSIISHNIWFSKDKKRYEQYELTPLLISPDNKLSVKQNSLSFFLSLLDTIEPTKRLCDENEMDEKQILESINITLEGKKIIIIVLNENLNFSTWFSSIKKMEDWLDVDVNIAERTLEINIKY